MTDPFSNKLPDEDFDIAHASDATVGQLLRMCQDPSAPISKEPTSDLLHEAADLAADELADQADDPAAAAADMESNGETLAAAPKAKSRDPVVLDGIYTVTKKIGVGGMASVYLAQTDLSRFDYRHLYAYTQTRATSHVERHREADAIVHSLAGSPLDGATMRAILISKDIPVPDEVVAVKIGAKRIDHQRFTDEWRHMLCLSHANVVHVYGGGIYRRRPYYAMELLTRMVSARAVRESFSLHQKLQVALDAANGLGYLHSVGIIHRDVKLANLITCKMASGAYITKVADLGLALFTDKDDAQLSRSGAILGTPHYMAPEQAHSPRLVDQRADIYALGATLYEMLSGRRPYADKASIMELLKAISVGERPQPIEALCPQLPQPVLKIIATAMQQNPDQRYQRMADMAQDLCTFLLGHEDVHETTDMPSIESEPGGGAYHYEQISSIVIPDEKAETDSLLAAVPDQRQPTESIEPPRMQEKPVGLPWGERLSALWNGPQRQQRSERLPTGKGRRGRRSSSRQRGLRHFAGPVIVMVLLLFAGNWIWTNRDRLLPPDTAPAAASSSVVDVKLKPVIEPDPRGLRTPTKPVAPSPLPPPARVQPTPAPTRTVDVDHPGNRTRPTTLVSPVHPPAPSKSRPEPVVVRVDIDGEPAPMPTIDPDHQANDVAAEETITPGGDNRQAGIAVLNLLEAGRWNDAQALLEYLPSDSQALVEATQQALTAAPAFVQSRLTSLASRHLYLPSLPAKEPMLLRAVDTKKGLRLQSAKSPLEMTLGWDRMTAADWAVVIQAIVGEQNPVELPASIRLLLSLGNGNAGQALGDTQLETVVRLRQERKEGLQQAAAERQAEVEVRTPAASKDNRANGIIMRTLNATARQQPQRFTGIISTSQEVGGLLVFESTATSQGGVVLRVRPGSILVFRPGSREIGLERIPGAEPTLLLFGGRMYFDHFFCLHGSGFNERCIFVGPDLDFGSNRDAMRECAFIGLPTTGKSVRLMARSSIIERSTIANCLLVPEAVDAIALCELQSCGLSPDGRLRPGQTGPKQLWITGGSFQTDIELGLYADEQRWQIQPQKGNSGAYASQDIPELTTLLKALYANYP